MTESPGTRRFLIVNADDFGISPDVNCGIIQAHEHGIVTSASLMVRYEAAREAATYGGEHPELSLGLHVDLGEWVYRDGEWSPLYEVVTAGDRNAIAGEIEAQLATFRALVGREPTHIDSHQHIHRDQPARGVLLQIANDLDIPLRHFSPVVRYRGDFYGQSAMGEAFHRAISVEGLLKTLASIPPGVTELSCHPGLDNDLDTMYRDERAMEVRTLCDPRIRQAIEAAGIQLCSFSSLQDIIAQEQRPE